MVVDAPDLRPYPQMKDSGVPWLGDVPEHWRVRSLRRLLKRVAERNQPDLPLLSVVREKGVIPRDRIGGDENHNFIPDDLSNYKVVRVGQFAMNKMKAWQGSYGVSNNDGIVSPAYFVFDVGQVDGNFFHAAIRSRAYVPFFSQASYGIRIGQWDLSEARMREIPFFVPSSLEQAAIARFLDHADRQIRRYIRAKQKMIKLLDEQKQAIIDCAVTGGFDSGIPLKPSGVKWLGDVPEHWHVTRLKSALSRPVRNGLFKTKEAFGQGVPLVNVADVYRDGFEIDPATLEHVTATPEEIATFRVRPGDLFFVRSSLKLEGTGRSAVALHCAPDTVFECHLVQASPEPGQANARFLAFQLNSSIFRDHLISRANVVTMATVAQEVLSSVPIVLPPLPEQESLLRRIDGECLPLLGAAQTARDQIRLVREYQTRLIADVVTGKLDVRGAAARLPEEIEEAEAEATDGDRADAEVGEDLEAEAVEA